MLGILAGAILKPLISGVTGYFKHKQEMRSARQTSELKWAETMAKATETSWKDEYITIVVTMPIIAAMFGYPELGERAFAMMHMAPEWFTLAFMTVVGGSFGVSLFGKYKKAKNGYQPISPVLTAPESDPMEEDLQGDG